MQSQNATQQPDWQSLLVKAVNEPGLIHNCYSRFWNYSFGNQILALIQAHGRGLELGPINTFKGWQNLGRQVRRGEKAIALVMPITVKRKEAKSDEDDRFTFFALKNNWFLLSQTDGADYTPPPVPGWDKARALGSLQIAEVPFHSLEGNSQGFARAREVSVSPLAALPHKTLFHELAHVVLGHTGEASMVDGVEPGRSLQEVEAESVALICCEALGLNGAEYARGYVQGWLSGEEIPARSAQRAMSAATKIIEAGRGQP